MKCGVPLPAGGSPRKSFPKNVDAGTEGPICKLYAEAREALSNGSGNHKTFIEVKHGIRQPLGWRTRGQATLERSSDEDDKIVIAKAGIMAPRECNTDEKQNEWIVNQFFNRQADSKYRVDPLASMRDIVKYGYDLVRKKMERHLSMEYDWKRRPARIKMESYRTIRHVFFQTLPWETVEDFVNCRDCWDDYNRSEKRLLKSPEDVQAFLDYKQQRVVSKGKAYVPKKMSSEKAFRMEILTALTQKQWGFDDVDMSYLEVAAWFAERGISTVRTDVENAKRRKLRSNLIVKTPKLQKVVKDIKQHLAPNLREDQLWAN